MLGIVLDSLAAYFLAAQAPVKGVMPGQTSAALRAFALDHARAHAH